MNKLFKILATTAVAFTPLLFCGTATAQSELSLEQAIALAKENNKSLSAAKSSLDAATYDFKSVRGNFYPQISLTGMGIYSTASGSYSVPGGNLPVIGADGALTGSTAYFPGLNLYYDVDWLFRAAVSLQQPIYLGGKVRSGYKMAKYGSSIALQNVRVTEASIVVETSKAYMNVVKAKELKGVALKYNALVNNLLKDVESAVKHGVASKNDLLKVEVKLNESLLALKRAENAERVATMNLAHLTGRPLFEKIEVNQILPEVMAEGADNISITSRPEYIMLEQKSEIARQQVKMARSEALPQLALAGSYGFMHGFKLNDSNLFGDWNFTAGVTLSVPIFHFREKANKIRSAKAKYEQVLYEEQEKGELMTLEAAMAANSLEEALLERELAGLSQKSATENLRLSESQYRAGVETLSDLLEAQLMWQQTEQQLIEATINTYVKWVEYQKAVGEIN